MERYGTIQDEFALKGFLLFVLRSFEAGLDLDRLLDISIDRVSDYFDFMAALSDLLESGHLTESSESGVRTFRITEKGLRDAEVTEPNIPYAIRMRTGADIERHLASIRRDAAIRVETAEEDGFFRSTFALDADHGTILTLSLLFPDRRTADTASRNFKAHAETIYGSVMDALFLAPPARNEPRGSE